MRLYLYERSVTKREHVLSLPFELTVRQQRSSRFLCDCLDQGKNAFLQAVCGSGKTEITLAAIMLALSRGMRIGFAICRKQIVIQLERRFRSYFPQSVVKAVYEEHKDDKGAHLVIMTIQQLINYRSEFALIIVDEADGFPYADSSYYTRLTTKALCPGGLRFLLSATIKQADRAALAQDGFLFHLNPERFHSADHDIPRFQFVPEETTAAMMAALVPICRTWLADAKPMLVFAPTVQVAERIAKALSEGGFPAVALTSKTSNKEAILARFRDGVAKIIVATTILERGVTFSNVQVCVIYADHRLFTAPTLIQIAGRVGRDATEPRGEIRFLSVHISKAMRAAKREIIAINRRKNAGVIFG